MDVFGCGRQTNLGPYLARFFTKEEGEGRRKLTFIGRHLISKYHFLSVLIIWLNTMSHQNEMQLKAPEVDCGCERTPHKVGHLDLIRSTEPIHRVLGAAMDVSLSLESCVSTICFRLCVCFDSSNEPSLVSLPFTIMIKLKLFGAILATRGF